MSEPLDYDEIVLEELSDEDLAAQMQADLYDGLADEVADGTGILLERGWSASRILEDVLVAGMNPVGQDFRSGVLFVPEVLQATHAMKAGMAVLKPGLAAAGCRPIGRMVIGTVKGDVHDVGKNLVAMMLEGAGFEVIDLGINVEADAYLNAIEEHEADILGMSALLTTTMPYMKVVIDALKQRGLREKCFVLVGGAPLNGDFGRSIGADAYCGDAAGAVEIARQAVVPPA